MAQGQVRHQPPEAVLSEGRTQWRGRRGQAEHLGDTRRRLDRSQLRMSAAEWQTGRKVAVHAQSIGRQYGSRRGVRVELRVMRREVNLAAGKRFGGRAARQVVETSRGLALGVRLGQ